MEVVYVFLCTRGPVSRVPVILHMYKQRCCASEVEVAYGGGSVVPGLWDFSDKWRSSELFVLRRK
jgi:hypothetical protein